MERADVDMKTTSGGLAPTREEQEAELRELQLLFLKVRDRPLPANATDAQRRARRLAELAFPDRLAALQRWVRSGQRCPGNAWYGLKRDLVELLEEIRGHDVRDRRESRIVEKG